MRAPDALRLEVVKGHVNDDELAALMAGIIARAGVTSAGASAAGASPAAAGTTETDGTASASASHWADPARAMRAPGTLGVPGTGHRSWRWAGRY